MLKRISQAANGWGFGSARRVSCGLVIELGPELGLAPGCGRALELAPGSGKPAGRRLCFWDRAAGGTEGQIAGTA